MDLLPSLHAISIFFPRRFHQCPRPSQGLASGHSKPLLPRIYLSTAASWYRMYLFTLRRFALLRKVFRFISAPLVFLFSSTPSILSLLAILIFQSVLSIHFPILQSCYDSALLLRSQVRPASSMTE